MLSQTGGRQAMRYTTVTSYAAFTVYVSQLCLELTVINFSCQQLYLQLYFPSYLFTCNTAENKNEDIFLIDFVNFGVAASYLGLPSVVKKFAYKAIQNA